MDPFALVLLGALVAGVLFFWLLGRFYPGSGLEQLGLKSAREIVERREELDAEDLHQMLAAHNARRRRRGEAEVTVADLEQRVMEDAREQRRRREEYLADRELDQLLEATNARRRARGQPERTREEVQREFGREVAPPAGGEGPSLTPSRAEEAAPSASRAEDARSDQGPPPGRSGDEPPPGPRAA